MVTNKIFWISDLVASEHDLQKKIAEMEQAKSVRSVDENAGGSHVQQPQEQLNVESPNAGKASQLVKM